MTGKTANTNEELTLDEISKISTRLGKLNNLFISGGEPFLRDDIAEICKIFYSQNNIRNIHLPTNGFYTEKIYNGIYNILRKCPTVKLTVGLSLDGLEKTHDKIKGAPGSFRKVIQTVHRIAPLKKEFNNFNLYIITVVNKINLDEIIELSEFIKNNLPVDRHGPSPMRGIPYDKALLPPTYKEWDDLSKKLIKYYRFWSMKESNSKIKVFLATSRISYLYGLYTYALKNNRLPFACQAGKAIAVLEPNGDVRLCELTQPVANVKSCDYNIKKVLFSEKAKNMRKQIKDCACTHTCFLNPSIEMSPASLIKSYLGKL